MLFVINIDCLTLELWDNEKIYENVIVLQIPCRISSMNNVFFNMEQHNKAEWEGWLTFLWESPTFPVGVHLHQVQSGQEKSDGGEEWI